ncbi:MAG TPA: FtsX-like permease family protein [Anaeromyxobacteraceae bacterium]
MALVAARYALRSTRRNLRRTALSVAGIGIGCALALFADSFNRGRDRLYSRAVIDNGVGHLRVVPAGWRRSRDPQLRLAAGNAALAAARELPGAAVAGARARAQALLAMGTRVVAVEMVGVEAEAEQRLDRLARKLRAGRWLRPGERGAAVLGQAALDRLRAELGDEVLATAVGSGGTIESAMLTVVGAIATGSEEMDASLCRTSLADVEALTGLAGPAEVTVLLRELAAIPAARSALAARLPAEDVMTWEELTPDFKGHIEQDAAFSRLFTGVILLVVLLGVGSAQLASVLERRREFAVLTALGTGAGRLVRLLAGEAILVGLAGAALALGLALPVLAHLHRTGIDFRSLMGPGWTFQGVVVEPIIYLDLGAWVLPEALGISLAATLLATLWPAWFVARTDPAEALRSLP